MTFHYLQTRQHLLTLKPTNRGYWFTFAVSQHLKKPPALHRSWRPTRSTLQGAPPDSAQRNMLLYKNMMLQENKQTATTPSTPPDEHKTEIVDVLASSRRAH